MWPSYDGKVDMFEDFPSNRPGTERRRRPHVINGHLGGGLENKKNTVGYPE